jgi:hypothetical protein
LHGDNMNENETRVSAGSAGSSTTVARRVAILLGKHTPRFLGHRVAHSSGQNHKTLLRRSALAAVFNLGYETTPPRHAFDLTTKPKVYTPIDEASYNIGHTRILHWQADGRVNFGVQRRN